MTHFVSSIQKLTATLSLAMFAGVTAPSVAQAGVISCPLDQIRREVTTPLPGGWWNTPIVNALTETRIITLGGKQTAQCIYGGAGSIMRETPRGETCTAIGGGFNCVAAAASVRTFSTAQINVRQTYMADFDRNTDARGDADIWFQAETRDLLYLAPRNGAKIGVGNRSNRGFAGCSTARYTSARVSLRDIPVGSYVCVKTNEGRISQFRVNGISGGSPKTLRLGYTTFE